LKWSALHGPIFGGCVNLVPIRYYRGFVVSRGMSNKCVSIRRNKLLSRRNQNNIIGQLLKVGEMSGNTPPLKCILENE